MSDDSLTLRLRAVELRLDEIERKLAGGSRPLADLIPAQEPETRIAWRHGRRPKFWNDVEVRRHIINRHRQITIAELHAEMCALFGAARTPSRTAMALLWKRIDATGVSRARAQRRAA
jgi:hypothetical protein